MPADRTRGLKGTITFHPADKPTQSNNHEPEHLKKEYHYRVRGKPHPYTRFSARPDIRRLRVAVPHRSPTGFPSPRSPLATARPILTNEFPDKPKPTFSSQSADESGGDSDISNSEVEEGWQTAADRTQVPAFDNEWPSSAGEMPSSEMDVSSSDKDEMPSSETDEALQNQSSDTEVFDDDQDEDDQELRTLYQYMNPHKYGNVDLAHPLCSPIDGVFGDRTRPRPAYFEDEHELL